MYNIRSVQEKDIGSIIRIYNENLHFLKTHMGMQSVDKKFVLKEITTMQKMGFMSNVIIEGETDKVIGVIDYQMDSTVYLSLLMIGVGVQGKGIGTKLYKQFEQLMVEQGCKTIRIDVVNDYEGHAQGFWERESFRSTGETVQLEWGEKQSHALVMKKDLDK